MQLGRASAAIYKSNSGPAPHIGILITHRTGNNLNNIACREMAKRGFVGVWLNTRLINNEALVKSEWLGPISSRRKSGRGADW